MSQTDRPNPVFHHRENRRTEDRRELTNPCMLIPVLAEGHPDSQNISVGFVIDMSPSGIGFEIAGDNRITTNQVVLGIEDRNGEMNFISALVRFSESSTASQRIGAEFVAPEKQLLTQHNLVPHYDRDRLKFETGLSEEVLHEWEACGVLTQCMHDKILLCPHCQSLPTWRNGCPLCGSASAEPDQLIHHYACAHISLVSEFEKTGELMCPKCLVKNLVVGADFEFLDGPERCHNCGWTDSKLAQIANCLACGYRFAGHQALEKIVNGYDVKRLDPLVFLA